MSRLPGVPRKKPAAPKKAVDGHLREHDRHVAAILAAVQILDSFEGDEELELKDLHYRTGLNKSRILRVTGTLQKAGLIGFDPDRHAYSLGVKLFRLGRVVERRYAGLIALLSPILTAISAETRGAAYFSVRRRLDRFVVARSQPPGVMESAVKEGRLRPIHIGASGRVLLALSSDPVRRQILKRLSLAMPPAKLLELEQKLETVRREQHAIGIGETNRTHYVISVPVWSTEGNLAGALSLSASRSDGRLPDEEQLDLLKRHATILSGEIGCAPVMPRPVRED
jgi:DNA-binding IclR family transcriptional regulator